MTSREPLQRAGEQVYPVRCSLGRESRELFSARARAVLPAFEPDEHLNELCARLDDLPLALELAAARDGAARREQLLERLERGSTCCAGGRDADGAQQTLRATIEW